jgi:hypothetical protein
LGLAEELGFGLVSNFSAYEAQHMSLFSTLLASILPTIHIYDGITVGRDYGSLTSWIELGSIIPTTQFSKRYQGRTKSV